MFSVRTPSKTIFQIITVAPLLFVATAIMLMHACAMEAQTVNWVTAQSPSGRCCFSMVYDGTTHSSLFFGGAIPGELYGDTWIWRVGWHHLSPATSPSPRFGAAMAYDATAGNVVLFGGSTVNNSAGTYFNDTWTWDGVTWTQQFPLVSPPARQCSTPGMVYDGVTGTVLLFGGGNSTGNLDDTWIWDGKAKTWTQLHPIHNPSTTGLMAYDEANKRVLLFGGGTLTETWTWNGASRTWTQNFPAHSPPVTQGAMAYDAAIGDVVLFGGFVGGWQDTLNATWTWNGSDWMEIYPSTVPSNRYDFSMDYDPLNRVLVMFGGYSSTVVRGDTWLLELEP